MTDPSRQDQQKSEGDPPPPADLVARPTDESWEQLLSRASAQVQAEGEPPRTPPSPVVPWLKASVPLLVVLLYLAFKFGGDWKIGGGSRWPGMPMQPASLTGVEPTRDEPLRLDKATREFVAELEPLVGERNYRAITRRIGSTTDAKITAHPVVRAFDAIARTHLGEKNLDLERRLAQLDSTLTPAEGDYPDLLRELRAARADQMLSRSASPDVLARNTDLVLQLLGPDSKTPYDVQVRLQASSLYEALGDKVVAEGRGIIRTDALKMREARVYYQTGLRFIVSSREWLQRTPVSPRAAPDVERITQKIRDTNSLINGISLPFTDGDSTTWSGKKDTPVHDNPAGGG